MHQRVLVMFIVISDKKTQSLRELSIDLVQELLLLFHIWRNFRPIL